LDRRQPALARRPPESIVNWFDLYLLHQPEPQYDVAPNYTPQCVAKP
jgi:hypothetical protein